MPLNEFQHRAPENVPGKYYVSDQCLDCDLCRETAPTVFARHDPGCYSYVHKQPETPEEVALVRECIAGCCVETIYDDGDTCDWKAIPANTPYYLTPEGQALHQRLSEQKSGSCCRDEMAKSNKKGCGGCLTAFVCVFLLIAVLLTFNALTPYLRDKRPVTITIIDEQNQPVADATLHVQEFEWIFFIPPLTFASPSHLIDRRRTVTTDSHGKAQFTVKLQNAIANRISAGGQPLRVLSYQTSDSFRGPGRLITVPAQSDYALDWEAIGGVSKVSYETAVVVSIPQAK